MVMALLLLLEKLAFACFASLLELRSGSTRIIVPESARRKRSTRGNSAETSRSLATKKWEKETKALERKHKKEMQMLKRHKYIETFGHPSDSEVEDLTSEKDDASVGSNNSDDTNVSY